MRWVKKCQNRTIDLSKTYALPKYCFLPHSNEHIFGMVLCVIVGVCDEEHERREGNEGNK